MELISHTTNVVCVDFIHRWRELQFKVDSELQIFQRTFHDNFIYSEFLPEIWFCFHTTKNAKFSLCLLLKKTQIECFCLYFPYKIDKKVKSFVLQKQIRYFGNKIFTNIKTFLSSIVKLKFKLKCFSNTLISYKSGSILF